MTPYEAVAGVPSTQGRSSLRTLVEVDTMEIPLSHVVAMPCAGCCNLRLHLLPVTWPGWPGIKSEEKLQLGFGQEK